MVTGLPDANVITRRLSIRVIIFLMDVDDFLLLEFFTNKAYKEKAG